MGALGRTVGEIMTRTVVSVSPSTPRAQVVELFRAHGFGAVPVLRDGHVVGVVSKGDVALRDGSTAAEIMTPVVHTVPPDFPVRKAAQRMLSLGIQRLLVVDRGAPVGVVTATDFLRALLAETEALR